MSGLKIYSPLTIDMGNYNGKCPICAESIDCDNENYETYVKNAEQRFQKMSLPVCYDCWCYQVECCDICYIPIIITYSTEIGSELLSQTTIVQTSEHDHVCKLCLDKSS